MAKQFIFKDKYVQRLKQDIISGTSLEFYRNYEFIYDKKQLLMLPNIKYTPELVTKLNPDNDYETAIQIYEAFEQLEPIQASDERLWTYLSHVDLYSYMIKRWDAVVKKTDNTSKYILDHWFLVSSSQNSLLRHALSGLWWSVFLSEDKSKGANRYDLTKILFRQLDFPTRTLGTYKLGRHKEAVIGILEFIQENEGLFKSKFEDKTRFITRHLNFIGGVKPISYHDRFYFKNELEKIVPDIRSI